MPVLYSGLVWMLLNGHDADFQRGADVLWHALPDAPEVTEPLNVLTLTITDGFGG